MYRIIVDCFGCDHPEQVILGVKKALEEIKDVKLIVTGNQVFIKECLNDYTSPFLEIVDAKEIITNEDSPVLSIRSKKDSSLVKGLNILKDNQADAIISCGNTGAVLCGASMILKRCENVERPALASCLPTDIGTLTCLADCGANVDCRPEHLFEFALFGSLYMRSVYGIENPRIGLLSNGSEDKKGNELTKETFKMLKESKFNFIGNIEAREALSGKCDVLVCDGFDGNVLLKSIEGTAKSVVMLMNKFIQKNAPKDYDLSFVKKANIDLFKKLDFNSLGGAILMGVRKIVIKGHGAANSDTIVNCIKQAIKMIDGGYINGMEEK